MILTITAIAMDDGYSAKVSCGIGDEFKKSDGSWDTDKIGKQVMFVIEKSKVKK